MLTNNLVLLLLNIYLVTCAPAAQRDDRSARGSSDQIAQGSNISGSVALFKPVIHREDARLEEEGIPSKVLSVYDNSQLKVGDFLNPQPIVDTIQEHEKYGNTGDKFYPVGRAIVNGYEGFSNVLNKLLDSPIEVAKTISRGITDSLNNVGGKIVGLNR
ncbi:uncharacterized protein LOC119075915 [Bradysia coprophila]|uniref:uncharacterized protein LOC119075915 n=1 Tax=Bradysia coprophila TaxID=38358 RepID=UPI00187DA67E|nr:uncharacterized protein LOC119075915 [Bradysia coprophila]